MYHGPSLAVCIGCLLGLLETCVSLMGTTLQRKAHVREEILKHETKLGLEHKPRRMSPTAIWWLGTSLFILAQFLMPLALGLAPMSLLAPLSSVQIGINLLLAYFFLGESVSRKDITASILCGCFACLVMVIGPHRENENKFVAEIIADMTIPGKIFMSCVLSLTFISLFIYVAGQDVKYNLQHFTIPWLHVSFTCYSLIATKGLGTIVINHGDISKNSTFWTGVFRIAVTLIGICCTALPSFYFQVKASQVFDQRWFVPTQYSIRVCLQLLQGAAVFNEWEGLSLIRIIFFLAFSAGCVISVVGISSKNTLQEKLDQKYNVVARSSRSFIERSMGSAQALVQVDELPALSRRSSENPEGTTPVQRRQPRGYGATQQETPLKKSKRSFNV